MQFINKWRQRRAKRKLQRYCEALRTYMLRTDLMFDEVLNYKLRQAEKELCKL